MIFFKLILLLVSQIFLCRTESQLSRDIIVSRDCTTFNSKTSDQCRGIDFWEDDSIHFCQEIPATPYKNSLHFDRDETCDHEKQYRSVKIVCCSSNYKFTNNYDDSDSKESSETEEQIQFLEEKETAQLANLFDCGKFEQKSEFGELNFDPQENPRIESIFSTRKYPLWRNFTANEYFSKSKLEFYEEYRIQFEKLKSEFKEKCSEMIELSKSDPGKAKRIFDTFKEKLGKNQQALWHKAKNRANIIEEKYETQLEVELTKLVHEKCQQFESMRASPNSQSIEYEASMIDCTKVLLQERTHFVNRYERLKRVDQFRVAFYSNNIHCRLNQIEQIIRRIIKTNQGVSEIEIEDLMQKFDDVNRAAEDLWKQSNRSCSTSDELWLKQAENEQIFILLVVAPIVVFTLIVLLLLLLVLLKKRSRARSMRILTAVEFTDKEPLQYAGFENPTYKFFEKRNLHS